MSATVSRDALANALGQVVRVVGTRSIIPELLIEAGHEKISKLSVTGTDGEHWAHLTAECFGTLDPITVDARKLFDVVQSLVGDEVGLSLLDRALVLRCGRGNRKLATRASEWPERNVEWPEPVELETERFAEAIRFVLPSTSRDDIVRPYLAGVHLIARGGKLRALGYDYYSGAGIEIGDCAQSFAATISLKMAEFSLRIDAPKISLSITDSAARIAWGGGYIDGPLVVEGFPAEAIIKASGQEYPEPVIIDGPELLRAIRGVRALGSMDSLSRSARIEMRLSKDNLTLRTNSADGEAEQESPASWEGDDIRLGFAATRMERMIGSFGDAVLQIGIRNPQDPMKFTAAGQTDRFGFLAPMAI